MLEILVPLPEMSILRMLSDLVKDLALELAIEYECWLCCKTFRRMIFLSLSSR